MVDWYGKGERTVEVASATALCYHTGLPPVPLRWVLLRDPQEEEKFEPQALLCTDLVAEPERISNWFVLRWKMEATFQEARGGISASKRSDSARSWPSGGRHLCFWVCSRSSRSWPIDG